MNIKKNNYTEYELQNISEHINKQEVNAKKAERDSIKYKQVEYLMDKIGHKFEAVITSIKDWGVYCEIVDNKCEGLIRTNSLELQGIEVISLEHIIKTSDGNKIYLGDVVKIEITSVNLNLKEIEYVLCI